MIHRVAVLAVLVASVSACSSSDDELTACESAMKKAHDVDVMQDTNSDLDEALNVCGSIAEFSAASAKFPDALDGTDPATYVANRCEFGTAFGAMCDEVGG